MSSGHQPPSIICYSRRVRWKLAIQTSSSRVASQADCGADSGSRLHLFAVAGYSVKNDVGIGLNKVGSVVKFVGWGEWFLKQEAFVDGQYVFVNEKKQGTSIKNYENVKWMSPFTLYAFHMPNLETCLY